MRHLKVAGSLSYKVSIYLNNWFGCFLLFYSISSIYFTLLFDWAYYVIVLSTYILSAGVYYFYMLDYGLFYSLVLEEVC